MTIGQKSDGDARGRQILEASLSVFTRYGFRKTSMDEVARAAHLSRQGLYLHFKTKEELFRATLAHVLESSLEAANAALIDEGHDLSGRLVGAFDAWVGRFVGSFTSDAADLVEAMNTLAPFVAGYEARFIEAVTKAIRGSGLIAALKGTGLTARQVADTLYATARGLKHSSATREAFVESFSHAARVMCFALREPQK